MEERKIGIVADMASIGVAMHRDIMSGNVAHEAIQHALDLDEPKCVVIETVAPEIGSAEEGLPLRLSIERDSPYYCAAAAVVGVTLNGVEYPGVVEYSVNMGFVRIAKPDADGRVSAYAAKNAEQRLGKVCVFWRGSPSRQVRRQLARVPSPR